MAFLSKVGNLLKQAASRQVSSELRVSNPSIFQAIRCISSFSSSKLFVGGLSYGTDDQSLREAFSKYGEVIEARIIMDRETGRSRGFGFITYTSTEEASSAIQALDGQDLHGRRVRVNYATDRARPNRSFGYDGQGGYGGYGGGQGGYGGGQGGYGGGQGGYGGDQGGYGQGGYSGAQGGYGGGQGGYAQGGYGGAQGGYASGQSDFGAPQVGYNPTQAGGSYGGNAYGSGDNNFSGNTYAGSNLSNPGVGNDSYASGSAQTGSSFSSGGFEGNAGAGPGSDQFGSADNSNLAGNNGDFGEGVGSEDNYRGEEDSEYAKRA